MNYVWIPIILFWIFFSLDLYKTRKGILPDASNEGNPLARYLYQKTSPWLNNLVHILYLVAVTVLALLSGRIGLWIGYSAFVGHFTGFLSWTRLNKWPGATKRSKWIFPMMFVVVLTIGYLLSTLHEYVWIGQ